MWVRIPLETYIFILNFSLPPRSEQVNGAVANEIKHVHSPEVIVVLDPRYDLSYKALYISTCSIALKFIKCLVCMPSVTSLGAQKELQRLNNRQTNKQTGQNQYTYHTSIIRSGAKRYCTGPKCLSILNSLNKH